MKIKQVTFLQGARSSFSVLHDLFLFYPLHGDSKFAALLLLCVQRFGLAKQNPHLLKQRDLLQLLFQLNLLHA